MNKIVVTDLMKKLSNPNHNVFGSNGFRPVVLLETNEAEYLRAELEKLYVTTDKQSHSEKHGNI